MKLIFSIIAVFILALGFSKDYNSTTNESALESSFSKAAPCTISLNWMITGRLRIRKACVELGVSCLKFETVKPCNEFSISSQNSENTVIKLVQLSDDIFDLYFFNDTNDSILTIDETQDLPLIICQAYKKSSITLLPGKYRVAKESNGVSKVTLTVKTK